MHSKKPEKPQSDLGGLILGAIILFIVIPLAMAALDGSGGPQAPAHPVIVEDYADYIDYTEGRLEAEQYPDFHPGEYEYDQSSEPIYDTSPSGASIAGDPCPYGCTQYLQGCDIKGNISFETGEKIYHVPGGEFYGATTINPDYGERWFCTEQAAQANGWRRSYR